MTRPTYSVIVPCHDEALSLPGLAERLARLREMLRDRGELEVVVVDDGSEDGTGAEAQRLFPGPGKPFRLLRHEGRRGIGASVATGIRAATGELIGMVDADGSYDPAILAELFSRVEEGNDMATASPYHPDGEVEGVDGWRLLLSRGVSRLYALVLPKRLFTYTSCCRAFRAEIAQRLIPTRDGFDSMAEMMCRALLSGHRVVEVPARLTSRRHGVSKLRVGREILHHLRTLWEVRWRRGPYAGLVGEQR